MQIQMFQKRDTRRAIRYAVTGMHFDWYFDSRFLQNLYGRYFWYTAYSQATQIIAAYENGELAGVLLARMRGGKPLGRSGPALAYTAFFELVQRLFFRGSAGAYEAANREMFAAWRETAVPDGEILFLAADQDANVRGVGTALLRELAAREPGKRIYLFTDDACTYQFYEHRGFERAGARRIELELGKKRVPLLCLLYAKVL